MGRLASQEHGKKARLARARGEKRSVREANLLDGGARPVSLFSLLLFSLFSPGAAPASTLALAGVRVPHGLPFDWIG